MNDYSILQEEGAKRHFHLMCIKFSRRRCHFCRRTQKDWDRDGRLWAKANDAGGYGIPGFLRVEGKVICDFCALAVTQIFTEVHTNFAYEEVKGIWRRRNSKTVLVP